MRPTTTGYGAVSYAFQMGEFDVTAAQYVVFLNAVATTSDPYGLYNSGMAMVGDSTYGCGIVKSGSAGSYTYTVAPAYQNFPVNCISWGDAARFCNWLQNGQPTSGTEGAGTTETGSYGLNGASSASALMAVGRSSTATYVIPAENEWYKAAYYKGGGTAAGYWAYPTKSNTAPINTLPDTGNHANFDDSLAHTGNGGYTDPTNYLTPVGDFVLSPGPYGTYDMAGDVYEWNETAYPGSDPIKSLRGGSWGQWSSMMESGNIEGYNPLTTSDTVGFRVASVAEPGSVALLFAGTVAFGIWRLRRNA